MSCRFPNSVTLFFDSEVICFCAKIRYRGHNGLSEVSFSPWLPMNAFIPALFICTVFICVHRYLWSLMYSCHVVIVVTELCVLCSDYLPSMVSVFLVYEARGNCWYIMWHSYRWTLLLFTLISGMHVMLLAHADVLLVLFSVRECVFFVFFQISKKTWLFTFFWNDSEKNVKIR